MRYIQDPVTLKLVPAHEYRRPEPSAPQVLPDIAPFRSPVTGEEITSRPQLREHNRRHGVTQHGESGENDGESYFRRANQVRLARERGQTPEARRDRLADIIPVVTRYER